MVVKPYPKDNEPELSGLDFDARIHDLRHSGRTSSQVDHRESLAAARGRSQTG
jgi:hypothetical protein